METEGSNAAAANLQPVRDDLADRLAHNPGRANIVAAGMALAVATVAFVDGFWTGIPVAVYIILLPALVAVPRRRGVMPPIPGRVVGSIFICTFLLLGLMAAGLIGAWTGYRAITFAAAAMVWIFGVAVSRLLAGAYQNAVRNAQEWR